MRRHALAVVAGLVIAVLAVLAVPVPAQAFPGIPDCKDAPTPEVPGRGLTGFFETEPAHLPPQQDPFAPGATTSMYDQYGFAGLRWNTYDLGCGPAIARAPDALVGTAIANWIYNGAKLAVAATSALLQAAFAPTFLSAFDPMIARVVESLRRAVFEQWVSLFVAALGFLLVWRARKANLASSTAAVAWALLVMAIASFLFRWPLVAGHAADQSVTGVLGSVSAGLNGHDPARGQSAANESAASLHEAILYQNWLAGEFGSASSPTARKYGPAIFDAQALTWRQARILHDDPAAGQKIIDAKQAEFKETAAKVQAEDPDAYEYLMGKRSDSRVGQAALADLAALCAVPFLIVSALLVIGALLIIRLAVMLFPVFATLGVFAPMRGLITGIANTVGAAIINCVIFGLGAAVTIKGLGLLMAPTSPIPPWLVVVLMLLLTLVMWVALRPFRRLTQMVSSSHNVFADTAGGLSATGRRAGRVGWRVASTAFGSFLGTAAAEEAVKGHQPQPGTTTGVGPPARAEANRIDESFVSAPVAAQPVAAPPVPSALSAPARAAVEATPARTEAGQRALPGPPLEPDWATPYLGPHGPRWPAAAHAELREPVEPDGEDHVYVLYRPPEPAGARTG